MNIELMGALNELENERGIAKEVILEAIEAAIVSAYKRDHATSQNLRVEMDEKTGQVRVLAMKAVADEVSDPDTEISVEDAKELDPRLEPDDVVEVEVTPANFGRIAAQTAKQVVIQRIREAERAIVYDEYVNREGDIVTGIVQRSERRNVFIDLGKVEAILPPSEQMPGEPYAYGTRLKVYIVEVRNATKGPQVLISRTHPGLLKRLFELEVPEIHDGTVEVKAVSREAGARSKIAVHSNDPQVDAIGACVGPRGLRVQSVVRELRGEKIDIIPWDPESEQFVANALSPARVLAVYINPDEKTAKVIVPENQLSLAIGKEGQNARLAARLSGWRVDIKSEEYWDEVEAEFEELRQAWAEREAEAAAEAAESAEYDDYDEAAETGEELPAEPEPVTAADAGADAVGADGDYVAGDDVLEDGYDAEGEGDLDDEAGSVDAPAEGEDAEPFVEEPVEAKPAKRQKQDTGALKSKKSRRTEKVEIQSWVEEEEGEEDAPLPTLFDAEDADVGADDVDIEEVQINADADDEGLSVPLEQFGKAKSDDSEEKKGSAKGAKSSKDGQSRRPKVLKGFDQLSAKDFDFGENE